MGAYCAPPVYFSLQCSNTHHIIYFLRAIAKFYPFLILLTSNSELVEVMDNKKVEIIKEVKGMMVNC